jgi:hypothetical protein
MTELVRYDAMCRAIAEAHAVDEVKAIRDKAVMLETYARISCDTDNERRAYEIRVRAERRYGELRQPPPMGRPIKAAPGAELLPDGVSAKQDRTWRKLADVPEEIFEQELANGASTKGIIKAATPPEIHPVADEALWLWGRLRDFEKEDISSPSLLKRAPAEVLKTLPDFMLDEVHVLAPRVAGWLLQIGQLPCQHPKNES